MTADLNALLQARLLNLEEQMAKQANLLMVLLQEPHHHQQWQQGAETKPTDASPAHAPGIWFLERPPRR